MATSFKSTSRLLGAARRALPSSIRTAARTSQFNTSVRPSVSNIVDRVCAPTATLSRRAYSEGKPDTTAVLNQLKEDLQVYAKWIPGGSAMVDTLYNDLQSMRAARGPAFDSILYEFATEVNAATKEGFGPASGQRLMSAVKKLSEALGVQSGDTVEEMLEKNPQLKETVAKNPKLQAMLAERAKRGQIKDMGQVIDIVQKGAEEK